METLDDFPSSPGFALDTSCMVDAYVRAKTATANLQKYDSDLLLDLTNHYYNEARGNKSLLRSPLTEAGALGAIWISKTRKVAEWYVLTGGIQPYTGINLEFIRDISKLSLTTNPYQQLTSALAKRGIALIYEPAIAGAKIDGVAFKLTNGTPVIGMSLRYSRLDYFWFTLAHELAHVFKHFDQLDTPIVDDLDEDDSSIAEVIANKIASDALIPRDLWRSCQARYTLQLEDVLAFSQEVGVAPEVVAGRIRRDLKRYELFSDLINKVDVREMIFGQF